MRYRLSTATSPQPVDAGALPMLHCHMVAVFCRTYHVGGCGGYYMHGVAHVMPQTVDCCVYWNMRRYYKLSFVLC